jgi:hypothetical protein
VSASLGIQEDMNANDQQSLWSWAAKRKPPRRMNGFLRALSIIVQEGRTAQALERRSVEKTCPRCGHTGDLVRDFGFRKMQGERRPQSWCRECRKQQSSSSSRRPPPESSSGWTLLPG